MPTARPALLGLLLACCLAAGCGSDSSDDKAASTAGPARPSAADVRAVTEFQRAVSDLVRESSFKDTRGTSRAIKEADAAFAEARDAIELAAPNAEAEITRALAEVRSEDARGHLEGVSRAAAELLNATNEASTAITGKRPSSSAAGLAPVAQKLKAAARDVEREAEASDNDGIERAYRSFVKLYDADRERVKDTAPQTDREISRALDELKGAISGADKEKLKEASEGLVKAVGEAPGAGGATPAGERTTCKTKATSKPAGLPSKFPTPSGLTITKVGTEGPTKLVDGYFDAAFDETYNEFKDAVERAGYQMLPSEKEEHDAEINYKGQGRTGQIALRADCSERDTTRIHITSRPA